MESGSSNSNYNYYEEKYDFSLTKSGRKLKSGKNKKKQNNNKPSCYTTKHIRVKLSKSNKLSKPKQN
jgi:hypothetical protein